ncbi:RelA/SpoT domain-containing protein [Mesorhizobium sp. BH1-1-5]|uniref:GTP pyrophosphokinase n=1 Tax=Mesorhizobium sp. BH1-1-5 TaxID=2876661 RepID=UPI001CCF06A1|nr:RelA/SpoT domain-containing protein [Mesorhizobium sp. BH1-1-5]MBZ9990030.1 RelA/SpoT domain-containing protein [Mesorhizobium sp. BH1-1-5]
MSNISAPSKLQISTDSLFLLDESGIANAYRIQRGVFEALRAEIVFILEDRIAANSIKIHTIESRVKELTSLLGKCARKSTNDPFSDFFDIAAARVICLFRSDLEQLKKIVSDNFHVISIDDKIEEGGDPLNYLSVHMACKMKPEFIGPRYEKILDKTFEIQLRTLCMHCWAAVSHYVDYKGDWDVPANLKMALSALSGLFYVADNEFEQFNAAMIASKRSAEETPLAERQVQDINFDTVSALLRRQFPDRKTAQASQISEFVQEIKSAGYRSLEQLESDLNTGASYPMEYEKKHKKGELFFIDVGAARHSLESISSAFAEVFRKKNEETSRASNRRKG